MILFQYKCSFRFWPSSLQAGDILAMSITNAQAGAAGFTVRLDYSKT
jgi:hypothetical protein